MSITLDKLEILPEEFAIVKDQVRQIAYRKWQAAGSPRHQALKFWLEAEQEWIEHDYVPHRDDLARR